MGWVRRKKHWRIGSRLVHEYKPIFMVQWSHTKDGNHCDIWTTEREFDDMESAQTYLARRLLIERSGCVGTPVSFQQNSTETNHE